MSRSKRFIGALFAGLLLVAAPARAAIGVSNCTSATVIAGAASTTLTYPGAVTAGSTLLAGGFDYNAAVTPASPSVSDGLNGAWTVKKYGQDTTDTNEEVFLATFENTAGGTPTVTFNPNGTSADIGGWFICEVTGAATPTSVDVTPAVSHTTGLTPSIASGTLAQASEAIFAVMSGNTSNGTVTIAGDGTYTQLVNNGDNATSQMGQAQYKIVASTASDTADWTLTDAGGGSQTKVSILISIKDAGGGGGGGGTACTLTLLGAGRCG